MLITISLLQQSSQLLNIFGITQVTVWGLELMINLSSTLLIAYQAWYSIFFDFYKEHSLNIFSSVYRQSIKAHLSKHKKTRVEIILGLLIESGFIYCGLWVITISFRYSIIILTTYFERLCLLPWILMLLTITILSWLAVCIFQ